MRTSDVASSVVSVICKSKSSYDTDVQFGPQLGVLPSCTFELELTENLLLLIVSCMLHIIIIIIIRTL